LRTLQKSILEGGRTLDPRVADDRLFFQVALAVPPQAAALAVRSHRPASRAEGRPFCRAPFRIKTLQDLHKLIATGEMTPTLRQQLIVAAICGIGRL
jgi:hypothetical protein